MLTLSTACLLPMLSAQNPALASARKWMDKALIGPVHGIALQYGLACVLAEALSADHGNWHQFLTEY